MELADEYRRARRNASILCAVGLAWATAQFEVRSLNVGLVGTVDLNNASIPLILLAAVVFAMARCTIEFAMQPEEVRRWNLAKFDYKVTLYLVRATVLMLAAGGIYRSVETIAYVALGTAMLLMIAGLMFLVGFLGLVRIMMYLRARQGRHSVAARVLEAEGWAIVIVAVALIVLLIGFGLASLRYERFVSFWSVPPSPESMVVFVLGGSILIVSVLLEVYCLGRLFAPNHPEQDA